MNQNREISLEDVDAVNDALNGWWVGMGNFVVANRHSNFLCITADGFLQMKFENTHDGLVVRQSDCKWLDWFCMCEDEVISLNELIRRINIAKQYHTYTPSR